MNRYGFDELNNLLFKIYLIFFIVNIFINSFVFDLIAFVLLFVLVFRIFSKNVVIRREENNKFISFKNKIKDVFLYKEDYIYKNCPKCKKKLKLPLPYKKGIKSVICPKCKKKFNMLVLRSQKIEIISNKNNK